MSKVKQRSAELPLTLCFKFLKSLSHRKLTQACLSLLKSQIETVRPGLWSTPLSLAPTSAQVSSQFQPQFFSRHLPSTLVNQSHLRPFSLTSDGWNCFFHSLGSGRTSACRPCPCSRMLYWGLWCVHQAPRMRVWDLELISRTALGYWEGCLGQVRTSTLRTEVGSS